SARNGWDRGIGVGYLARHSRTIGRDVLFVFWVIDFQRTGKLRLGQLEELKVSFPGHFHGGLERLRSVQLFLAGGYREIKIAHSTSKISWFANFGQWFYVYGPSSCRNGFAGLGIDPAAKEITPVGGHVHKYFQGKGLYFQFPSFLWIKHYPFQYHKSIGFAFIRAI